MRADCIFCMYMIHLSRRYVIQNFRCNGSGAGGGSGGNISHIARTFQEGRAVGVSGFHRLESETLPFMYELVPALAMVDSLFLGMNRGTLLFSGSAHQSVSRNS